MEQINKDDNAVVKAEDPIATSTTTAGKVNSPTAENEPPLPPPSDSSKPTTTTTTAADDDGVAAGSDVSSKPVTTVKAEAVTTAAATESTDDSKDKPSSGPKSITIDTVATATTTKDGDIGNNTKGGGKADEDGSKPSSMSAASQARTPKHANISKDGDDSNDNKSGSDEGGSKSSDPSAGMGSGGPVPPGATSSYPGGPPRPYEGRPLGGGSAFQPTEPASRRGQQQHHPHHSYHHPHPASAQYSRDHPGHPHHMSPAEQQYYTRSPMQISPGGGRYYDRRGMPPPGAGYHSSSLPPPPPGYYDRGSGGAGGYNDYGGPVPSIRSFDGGPGGPPPYHQQYGGGGPPSHYGGPNGGGGPGGPMYDRYGDPRGYPGGGGPPPMSSQYGPPPSHHGGGYPPSHGGGPPHHGDHYPPRTGARHGGYPPDQGPEGPGVSRAVSSSFDRSSKDGKPTPPSAVSKPSDAAGAEAVTAANSKSNAEGEGSMASDDDSWKQLKQVHSIDDSAIQEHLGLKKGLPTGTKANAAVDDDRHPPSNSSSLTNSPTEGPERRAKAAEALLAAAATAAAASSAKQSSLDELSSVASAQAPMDTTGAEKKSKSSVAPASPATDSGSLDLMKCSSGSSALLPHLPPHDPTNKRGRDEERGDGPTTAKSTEKSGSDEIRRAPSGVEETQPPLKKSKVESQKKGSSTANAPGAPKAKSPDSITFSPGATKKPMDGPHSRPSGLPKASPLPGENSFYDRPPAYSYSLDSAPPLPGGGPVRKAGHGLPGNLPPRPGSSASSSLTHGQMQDPSNAVMASIPSWEIQAQDSFGGGSVGGGHGLANNFSFQDYMLSSESNLGPAAGTAGEKHESGSNGTAGTQPTTATSSHLKHPGPPNAGIPPHLAPPGMGVPPPHPHSHAAIESRNQSFEGGHYHGGGSFHRSDSMDMGYPGHGRLMGPGPGRPMLSDPGYKHGHTGQFPPHAPSWGTAGSSSSHPSYQGHPPPGPHPYSRMGDYPIMRNYSHESAHRASPPPGPPGVPRHYMHHTPSGFQPPPEFVAPHNPMGRRPPPAVYIMSSSGSNQPPKRGAGVFSWTKDDDIRLTEVMKKYKNPRDWEPIAKEHGMGKTAKECHERWIRYLKPGVRKGQWTDQEDAIVIEAVQTSTEQPFTRWSDLAQRLPGRVGKQIRDRWVNHLNPNINHLPFSREDDLLLWDGHKKLGKRWVEISTKFFNSTRSENHIKNRWYSASFKKFISNEFGMEAYSGGKPTSKGKEEKTTKGKRKPVKNEDPATYAV